MWCLSTDEGEVRNGGGKMFFGGKQIKKTTDSQFLSLKERSSKWVFNVK